MKICSLLWRQLYVSENGSFYPCCLNRGFAEAEFLDETGAVIKIDDPDSLARAWNSPTLKKLREEMLAGNEPNVCQDCFEPEKRGDRSVRIKNNDLYLEKVAPLSNSVPVSEIRALDVRWGNICNLKCRMCYPDFSRALLPEHIEVYGLSFEPQKLAEIQSREWFRKKDGMNLLGKLENLDTVNFAGGEPLVVKESYELLKDWVKTGKSKSISLSYNTNLTVLPSEVLELWPSFKEVKIYASIDGYQEVNSYIRYPSNWNKIESNLRFLDHNYEKLGLKYLGVHTALQIYNVFSFPNLIEWLRTFHFVHPYPDLTILNDPEHFDLRCMPAELKELAAERLKSVIPKNILSPKDSYFASSIEAALVFLKESKNKEDWERFLSVTQYFDKRRGQSVKVIPELFKYFCRLKNNPRMNENVFPSPVVG